MATIVSTSIGIDVRWSRIPREAVAQPDETALQHLATFQCHPHRVQGARLTVDVKYGRFARHALYARVNADV
jgi:hypothetical protein